MSGEEWIAAIREGNLDDVRRLLEENGELVGFEDEVRSFLFVEFEWFMFCFCFEKRGRSLLSWACEEGHLEIVRLLVERGASINQKDENDRASPCYFACENGHLEIIRMLVELGADINQGDENSWTPCHIASQNGHLEVVQLLLDRGANPLIKEADVSRVCLYWF